MGLMSGATSGAQEKSPISIILYGVDGVGKTTFAAAAPNPYFLDLERGSLKIKGITRVHPVSYPEVLERLRQLRNEKHDFKTVVLDSLDWLEGFMWPVVLKQNNWTQEAALAYGRGNEALRVEWLNFRSQVMELQIAREMNIILLGHALVKTFQDPQTNVPYDRYQIKMIDKGAAVLREAVDCVLFANYDVVVKEEKGARKGKAYGKGERVMYTEHRPAFDAKNRFALPFALPLDWDDFYLASTGVKDPKEILAKIEALIPRLSDENLKKTVEETVKKAGDDVLHLLKILERLTIRLGE